MNNLLNSRIFITLILTLVIVSHCTANSTWSEQKLLNLDQIAGDAYNLHPKIASDNCGNVMALWRSNIIETGFARLDLAFSPTRGTSYGSESYIDFGYIPGLSGNIAYAGNGIWVCVATMNTDEAFKGVFSRSFDNGRTWTIPMPLYKGKIYHSISLASDKAGTLIASAGSALVRSTDFGATWIETPEIVSPEGDFWTSPVGVLESRINTDGSDRWVHAYLRFDAHKTIFSYHALVSSDNGSTWKNVLDGKAFESYKPTLNDVAISGSDIVMAASINNKSGLFLSKTAGQSWSDFKLLIENCRDSAVAVQDSLWSILASPMSGGGPLNFMSYQLEDWTSISLIGRPFIGNDCAITAIADGGFAALMRDGKKIVGMTYGVISSSVPSPDLAISFKTEPKVRIIEKQSRDTRKTVIAKILVSNLGELDSDPTIVKCWLSNMRGSQFAEPKYFPIRRIKAVKPGKRPKTKAIKVRIECSYQSPDYINTQVMQNFEELNPTNNLTSERISHLY